MQIFFITVASFIILGLLVYVWYRFCENMAGIAADKGYPERKYFHYCFWLGLPGVLMIIAMPDLYARRSSHGTKPSTQPENARPAVVTTRPAAAGAFPDRDRIQVTKTAADPEQPARSVNAEPSRQAPAPRPAPPRTDSWVCPVCKVVNRTSMTYCIVCGCATRKPSPDPVQKSPDA